MKVMMKQEENSASFGTPLTHKKIFLQQNRVIEVHRKTETKLEDMIHECDRYCHSLCKDYKYAKRDLQNLRAETGLLRDRHSGAVMALTKNCENELVELDEQGELKKRTRRSIRPLYILTS